MTTRWRTVVFVDLDNTIIKGFDSEVLPRILDELSKKSGLGLDKVRRLALKENRVRRRNPNVSAERAMDWDDIVNVVAKRLGVRLKKSALEVFKACACPPFLDVIDCVHTVLQELKSPHRKTVVATHGLGKYQVPVLDALNLTPFFKEVLTPDSNSALKREMAFFGRWPASSDLQIMVGDNYKDDIIAASRLGFKTIWKRVHNNGIESNPFDRPNEFSYPNGYSVRPDAIIYSLKELPKVIAQFEEREYRAASTLDRMTSWSIPSCSSIERIAALTRLPDYPSSGAPASNGLSPAP